MPRIRTVKPEAFVSESLAEVTVEAERTFFGLLTQADDHGRHRDNAAIIAGLLWPLRAEHTSVHVEDDLTQLAEAGLICRYTGCDGRRYLHVISWYEHQKIDRPSQSRMPTCPHHHAQHRCGPCKGICARHPAGSPEVRASLDEGSANDRRPLEETAQQMPGGDAPSGPPSTRPEPHHRPDTLPDSTTDDERAAQQALDEPSSRERRDLDDASTSGSRILDPGSCVPTGREAPDASASAHRLVGEYVAACAQRPPGDVVGHVGRVVKRLLGEGIGPEYVRAGLRRFAELQGHPSRLPSLVNDAMNAPSTPSAAGFRRSATVHTAWVNPADPATAYAEEL